ncbi:hypothetical protein SBC1_59870 (plasmid) [Caballeronia sp. SBC1]|uniref:hypothetical protein n=1 Tax=unclassified Caballeronia TaxID=2646786 RepID=UPI0013E20797|nr:MULTISPECIES: hypothetical protein [unclassified Caballeronia]QIE27876.1 hypothetical protein SBC2_59510 [Caballeronia sp. SBC2]QIN65941.1 hypothetical protein SBC1_59870 [Caballeronia sp. SBC1]
MKTGRREFIGAASLVAACGGMPWPAQASVRSTTLHNEYDEQAVRGDSLIIIFDERVADSRAFAFRSRTRGVRTVPLGNDIGTLWFQHLMPLASSPGNVIAGLTRHADAFLLTRFAQGIGLRIAQHSAEAHAGPDTLVMWRLDTSRNRT